MADPARPLQLQRTDSTFEEIPVINFEAALSSDPAARRALADQIADACINVGFFYLKNHTIPEDVISRTVEYAKRFFDWPEARKMELDIHKSANFKGYTALLGENTDPMNLGDVHEGFDLGWEAMNAEQGATNNGGESTTPSGLLADDQKDNAMSGSNVWPDGIPGFRESVLEYYHEAVKLGLSLFPLFALALNLPDNFFDDKTTKPAAIMRLLHYPPQPPHDPDNDGKQIGIGAHTDYECFTILWQDTAGGLQVRNTAGKWVDAVPIPGTLVVNLGDQFARWTNDVFKSTVHRAINRSGSERYSIPLFFGTDYNVPLGPIPTCISEDNPPKYEVVTAGEYVKSRLEATYAHSKPIKGT
ncbi:hypothetical protein AX16_008075 [Volvariella volvacea WC 439]|nr:hypothetical protein AX16_008075 [Volvariella volvacea WC 439]